MMTLNEQTISSIFFDCLGKDEEIIDGNPSFECTYVKANVPSNKKNFFNIGFKTSKINEHKQEIIELLSLLSINKNTTFDDLYVDKSGNKWCDDPKILDQIILLGIACGSLSCIPIEGNNERITIVSRIYDNDKSVIEGIKPNPDIVEKYKERLIQIIEAKKQIITDTVNKFKENITVINDIFQMFGFKPKIEDEKILIDDIDGNSIGEMEIEQNYFCYSEKIDTSKGELEHIYSINGKAKDGGNIYNNTIVLNNLVEMPSDGEKKKFTGRCIRIEVGMGQNLDSNIPIIDIKIIDPNARDIITEFSVDSYSFRLNLENDFGPYGNYIDGTHRAFDYEDIDKIPSYYPSVRLYESVYDGGSHYLQMTKKYNEEPGYLRGKLESSDWTNGKQSHNFSKSFNMSLFRGASREMLVAPRVKALFEYILNSIDKTMPGMKNYILKNYSIIREVSEIMNTNNNGIGISEEMLNLINSCTVKECDLPNDYLLENGENIKK